MLSSGSIQHPRTNSAGWYYNKYNHHPPSAEGHGHHFKLSEQIDRSKLYEGPSLDEIALVSAARENGFCLCERTSTNMFVRVMGRVLCYEIIAELEFTPERKLMSVLLRRNPAHDSEEAARSAGNGGGHHYYRDHREALGKDGNDEAKDRKGMPTSKYLNNTSFSSFKTGDSTHSALSHEHKRGKTAATATPEHDPVCGMFKRYKCLTNENLSTGLPITGKCRLETLNCSFTRNADTPYLLLVKGADKMMFDITNMVNPRNQKLKKDLTKQLDEMANKGLRTLVLGQRQLSQQEVIEWMPIFNSAQCSISSRGALLHKAYALLEKDIDLIGATAVEDRLQDGVPETLRFFAKASIVVWMLTGDKRETAIKIAFTSGLMNQAGGEWIFHLDAGALEGERSGEETSLLSSPESQWEGRGVNDAELDNGLSNMKNRKPAGWPDKPLTRVESGSTDSISCPLQRRTTEKGGAFSGPRSENGMPTTMRYYSSSISSIVNSTQIGKKREGVGRRIQMNDQNFFSAAEVIDAQLEEGERLYALAKEKYGETKVITLVLDGKTLEVIFSDDKRLERFFALSCNCHSAICCRMTPLQKAQIVSLFQKKTGLAALAVGDGANDVSMILESRIGVSIMGLEGSQAELASDYAIPKFRFLKRLLMVHGRFSIYRDSHCILYSIYKNVILVIGLYTYCFYSAFSGVSFIDSWLLALYGVFFVLLQPIAIGTLDKDVPDELAESIPQLYPPLSRELMYFSRGYIAKWLLDGVIEGSVYIFFLIYCIMRKDVLYPDKTAGIEDYGQVFFTMVVLAANLRMIITFRYLMIIFIIIYVVVMVNLPLFEIIYAHFHTLAGPNSSAFIAMEQYSSYNIYICIIFVIGVSIVYTISSNNCIQMTRPWTNAAFAITAAHASPYRKTSKEELKRLKEEYRCRSRLAREGGGEGMDASRRVAALYEISRHKGSKTH
ncbi:unnamed protein product [Phytomonas sp. Hart1]|nr:unnamed protein product [Phytomonas sp. Hart1]|eukprot:CCW66689.1 unnamed protein product [Phytomonas sp. isolate Hart1]